MFEVHHNLVGEKVTLVFNPHTIFACRLKTAFGDNLGAAVLLDLDANLGNADPTTTCTTLAFDLEGIQREHNVELVFEDYVESIGTFAQTTGEDN